MPDMALIWRRMTNPDYTHLLVIVDRSGSMATCYQDMIGGLDTLFAEQAKLEGECLVDYVQFDTEYELVFENVPVAAAKAQLQPRGGTALLDAIGKGVTTLGEKLDALDADERPGKVLVVIITDGHENASVDWTADSVKTLIAEQESTYSWDFTFLGANIDAVAVGQTFGVSAGKTLNFNTNNIEATSMSLNTYVGAVRGAKGPGGAASVTYSDEDRKANS